MLYDQVIRGLGSEFIHHTSEIDVPPEAQSKWGEPSPLSPDSCRAYELIIGVYPAKAKERFPTFFVFQALKLEYEESERRATSFPNGLLQSPLYHNALSLHHFAHIQNVSLARRGGDAPAEVVPVRLFELCLHSDADGRLSSRTSDSILKWCHHPPVLRLIFPTANLCMGLALITQVEVHRTHRVP